METANREKKPELHEIHYGLQEQGKRLQDALSRLTAIGNRLEDESNIPKGEAKEPTPLQSKPILPGLNTDLNNTLIGYRECITYIENQLSKIERHI